MYCIQSQLASSRLKRYFLVALSFACFLATSFAETKSALQQDSGNPITRGFQQLQSGHEDAALTTFDEVLMQDADNLDARVGQAIIFSEQKRYKDAFTAYDLITQQNPHHIAAWNGRGLAAFNMENFDEALVSFKMSVADQPVDGFLYESIAWTQMCRGEFVEAAEWAKKALLMYNRKGKAPVYPLLIAYFSYHESGDAENALRVLKYAIQGKSSSQWPAKIIDYLNNKIDEAELISSVSSLSEETEAHTYIGLHMRLLGKAEEANRHLDWVGQNGDSQVFEYTLARVLVPKDDVVLLER